jgi:ribosomal protein L28
MEKIEKTELEEKLTKILARKTNLFGNNRSFSMKATKRKFKGNIQKFKIGNKTYTIRVKDFRSLRLY